MSGRNLTFGATLGTYRAEDQRVVPVFPEADLMEVGRQWLSQISP